eukprot:GHVS01068705.1.p1 GENE.GHVS01068705.1~~GHVS01068705.1.p1  ORF type:complete len:486 (+),score=33.50 GHVS01068705.1:85-1542(+)
MNPSRYTWIALLVGSVGMGGCYDFGNMYDQDTSYFLGPGLLTLLGLETSHCHDSFTNLLPLRLMTLPDLRKVANERGVESVVEGEVAVEDVVNIDSEEYSYREDKDTAMFYDRIKHEFFVFTNALPDRKLFMSIFEETGGDYYYIGDAASGGLEDPLNMLTNFPESRVCVDNSEVVRQFLKAHPIDLETALLNDVGFRDLGCTYKWAVLGKPFLRRHQWLGGGEVTIAKTDEQFKESPYVKLYLYANAHDVQQMYSGLPNNNKDVCFFDDDSNRMVFNEARKSLSIYTKGGFGPKNKNHIGFKEQFLSIIKTSGASYKLEAFFDHHLALLQFLSGCTILVEKSKDFGAKVERKMKEIDQLRYSSVFVMKDQQVHIAEAVDRNNYIELAVVPVLLEVADKGLKKVERSNFEEYVLYVNKVDTNEIVTVIKQKFERHPNQMPPTLGQGFEDAKDAVIELVKSNFCRVHPTLLNDEKFRKMGKIAEAD